MTAVPRPSPRRRFPRHCVVVHDLQLGPHLCAQSCYACPDLTAARCTRCHCANLRANTRAVSRHRPGRTRCANAPPPPPHPPAWTSFPKAGAAAGAAAGAQSFVTRAVARANERKRRDRRVEFGGVHRQQFSGRGRSSFPFSSICSFPRKNVQKVGGYHTKKLRRSQLLPNPTLEVPITLADARGHDVLASAQVMGTSNVGLGSK